MNTKYVTSLELSKLLKEAGIPQESEYVWRINNGMAIGTVQIIETERYELSTRNLTTNLDNSYSAFHVGELGDLLPKKVIGDHPVLYLTSHLNEKNCSVTYETFNGKISFQENAETEAEVRGKMLLYLKGNKLI